MGTRKETRKYCFTVEGETEQWYLDWLQGKINECQKSLYKVSIISKVQQNPKKFIKTVNPISTPEITHWCDFESSEETHSRNFLKILDQLKEADGFGGKRLKYRLGYSNFTFELWMVLHQCDCNSVLTSRTQYLGPINRAYGEQFENLDQYKREDNFKRCLKRLSIDNVTSAVNRAKEIMKNNSINGFQTRKYKGFEYYIENPSLTIWKSIEGILAECEIMPADLKKKYRKRL